MKISAASTLVDSNLLLRIAEPAHALHFVTLRALANLRGQEHELSACSQNFTEFWTVATRPHAVNGLGLTPVQAEIELANLEKLFPILPDDPAVYPEWRRLVTQARVSGKPTHDARMMAFAVVSLAERKIGET